MQFPNIIKMLHNTSFNYYTAVADDFSEATQRTTRRSVTFNSGGTSGLSWWEQSVSGPETLKDASRMWCQRMISVRVKGPNHQKSKFTAILGPFTRHEVFYSACRSSMMCSCLWGSFLKGYCVKIIKNNICFKTWKPNITCITGGLKEIESRLVCFFWSSAVFESKSQDVLTFINK